MILTLAAEHGKRLSAVESSLADKSYSARVHALRLSEPLLVGNDSLLAKVLAMTGDDDPRVRLQLALTLGESRDARALDALSQLAIRHGNDRWMSAAILSGAGDTSEQMIARLLKASKTSDGATALLRPLASSVGARRDDAAVGRLFRDPIGHASVNPKYNPNRASGRARSWGVSSM